MIPLQTKVDIPKPNFQIDYNSRLNLLGSCFSDNIGNKLIQQKFRASVNPFGVLYNPASIAQAIDLLFTKEKFDDQDLDFHKEKWFSYAHHTSFSNTNKTDCLKDINQKFYEAAESIRKADVIIITLGTSWIFHHILHNRLVANCHKIPAKEFERTCLSPAETESLLRKIILQISKHNSNAKFIFTISPIRHWKDGAIENMRSKSALAIAIQTIEKEFEQAYYFPTYEIFMDELRDYRFYASDMLHPSDFAIDYTWHLFKQTFFSKETQTLNQQVVKIVKSFQHRSFNTDTKEYQIFKNKLLDRSMELERQYPVLNFTEERNKIL